MRGSPWKTALVDISRDTEFSGDDVDQISELVDLGKEYNKLLVFVPTIDSATVSVMVQRDGEIDTVPVVLHVLDDDATGSFLHATSAGTGGIAVIFEIGGCQFVRVVANANQSPDITFNVRGIDAVDMGL